MKTPEEIANTIINSCSRTHDEGMVLDESCILDLIVEAIKAERAGKTIIQEDETEDWFE